MAVLVKGIRLSPSWTVFRRPVPGLLRSLAVLEHCTVPSGYLVVLRTAEPVIELATSVADDRYLGRGCTLGHFSTRRPPLCLVPLPGRDWGRVCPQPTLCGLGLGLELCQPLIIGRIPGIVPGIPRLYQRLTEVPAIRQLYRGDQLAATISSAHGYGVHNDGDCLPEGCVTRDLARLRAKGLPASGTSNPVEA